MVGPVSFTFSPLCAIQGPNSLGGGGSSHVWTFEAAGRSDLGLIRERNEDAFRLLPERGLFFVADGMGGHRGGHIASQMAVDGLEDFLQISPFMNPGERTDALRGAFDCCSSQIYDRARSDAELIGMGTTLSALHLNGSAGMFFAAWAGDSRIYRIRGDAIQQITEDHSFQNECKALGYPESAWSKFSRSTITRAVGLEPQVQTDIISGAIEPSDIFLLCTDGLTEVLLDEALLRIVKGHTRLEGACEELVARANEGGGPDNITAVLVRALKSD